MLKLLDFGIDSLNLRIEILKPSLVSKDISKHFSDEFFEQKDLMDAYSYLAIFDAPTLTLDSSIFYQSPKSKPPYRYHFINPVVGDIFFWSTDKFFSKAAINTGQIYLEFRSQFLYYNQDSIYSRCLSIVSSLFSSSQRSALEINHIYVSRVDLQATTSGHDFSSCSPLDDFISRSKGSNDFPISPERKSELLSMLDEAGRGIAAPLLSPNGQQGGSQNQRPSFDSTDLLYFASLVANDRDSYSGSWSSRSGIETLYFGKFTSSIYARLYNKSKEIKRSNKTYLVPNWIERGWDPLFSAWRLEFSLSGDFLKEICLDVNSDFYHLGLNYLSGCLSNLPQIWNYCTSKWLRHIDRSSATRSSRCDTSQIWQLYQLAFNASSEVVLRKPLPVAPDLEQLQKQIEGCLLTLSSRVMSSEPEKVSQGFLISRVHDYLVSLFTWQDSPDFPEQVRQRMIKHGYINDSVPVSLETFSDTDFSSSLRKERYSKGLSS